MMLLTENFHARSLALSLLPFAVLVRSFRLRCMCALVCLAPNMNMTMISMMMGMLVVVFLCPSVRKWCPTDSMATSTEYRSPHLEPFPWSRQVRYLRCNIKIFCTGSCCNMYVTVAAVHFANSTWVRIQRKIYFEKFFCWCWCFDCANVLYTIGSPSSLHRLCASFVWFEMQKRKICP